MYLFIYFRFFTFIRFINKCYMKIDHHIYLLHTENAHKLVQYISEHPTDLLKIIKYISAKIIHDIKNDQKRLNIYIYRNNYFIETFIFIYFYF